MSKKALETAKELLKAVQDPAKAQELSKALAAAAPVAKDDKPHPAGSPQAAAHDVKEFHKPLQQELHSLPAADMKSKMLTHLRSLSDPSKLRSPENVRSAAMEKWEPRYMKKTGDGAGAPMAMNQMQKQAGSPAPAQLPVPRPSAGSVKKPIAKPKPQPIYHSEMLKADIHDLRTGAKLATHAQVNPPAAEHLPTEDEMKANLMAPKKDAKSYLRSKKPKAQKPAGSVGKDEYAGQTAGPMQMSEARKCMMEKWEPRFMKRAL